MASWHLIRRVQGRDSVGNVPSQVRLPFRDAAIIHVLLLFVGEEAEGLNLIVPRLENLPLRVEASEDAGLVDDVVAELGVAAVTHTANCLAKASSIV